jgi:putative Holliday junction resolvase
MRILAVDHGVKRCGLALSDSAERLAVALPTLEGADAASIAAVAREHEAELVVVGLPLNMDGSEGPAARRSRAFADELRREALEVALWDERLTTAEGNARLRQAGLNRKERARREDAAAAIVILESFLEARKKEQA